MKLPKGFFNSFFPVKLLNVLLILIPFVLSFFLIYYFSHFPIKQVYGEVYSTDPPTSTGTPPPGGDPCDGVCDPTTDYVSCPSDCGGSGPPDPNCETVNDGGAPLWCSDNDECGGAGWDQWYCQDPDPAECGGAGQCGGTCECGQNNTSADCDWACIAGSCVMDCGPGPGGDDDDDDDDGCNTIAPDPPQLSSPSDDAILPLSTSVVLTWEDVTNWGENCMGNLPEDHNYKIFIGTVNPPNKWYGWENQGTTSFPVPFVLENKTYYWRVTSENGAETNWSDVWSFTMRTGAWYQTQGGDIHADGGGITSIIPKGCELPDCNPYLMLNEAISGQSGVSSWLTGSLELGDDYPDNVSEDGNNWQAMAGGYSGIEYNYDFWNYILGDEESDNLSSGSLPNPGGTKIYKATGDLDIEGDIDDDSKVIILHNKVSGTRVKVTGDIEVDQGGFLMVITNGDIEVDDIVEDLQGIFIADGTISFGSEDNDDALTVEGSLIGWQNINLSARDFGDVGNDTQPILTFIYRPDLIIEAPEIIRRPQYTWREIAP